MRSGLSTRATLRDLGKMILCLSKNEGASGPVQPNLGKLFQEAQRRKNHRSEENLMRMNLVSYYILKVEKIN
jgi:hypothetical protein